MSSKRSRRRFLGDLTAAAAAGLAGCSRPRSAGAQSTDPPRASARARVVLVTCPGLGAGASPDRAALGRMLELGLRTLAGTHDARAALARWLRPVDTVGLKVNCLAGRMMSTHVELVESLVTLLAATGLPRSRAVVFDRSDADLRGAGYRIRSGGSDYLCLGNDHAGYEDELTVMPSGASRFSRVATRDASVLINLPVLKDHGLAGLTAALKNNFGLVHNPNKYHLDGCDPHVAEVNSQDSVRRKQRLIICDALRVQTDGGPAYHPAAVVDHGALLLATDPVALDTIAWELLEELRARRGLPTLAADKRRPVHIQGAARRGLGVGDRKRIDLLRVRAG